MLDNEILKGLENRLNDLAHDNLKLYRVTKEYTSYNVNSAMIELYSNISIDDKNTLDSIVEIIKKDCLKKIQADERKIYELAKQYIDLYENRENK